MELVGFANFGGRAVSTKPLDDVFRTYEVQQFLRLKLSGIKLAQDFGNFQSASDGLKEIAVSDGNLNSVALFQRVAIRIWYEVERSKFHAWNLSIVQ